MYTHKMVMVWRRIRSKYSISGTLILKMNVMVMLMFLQTCLGTTSTAVGITRKSFPEGFVFGTASSAYQYEGAVKEDGRGPSIWDRFAHQFGKIRDSSNADVTVDQYHLYESDIKLMKDMGMDAYRFSISWSRIFPDGNGEINQAGVDHYNNLIDALLAHGIQPYVTLYHWDLPQALEDRYNGWLDQRIINDFATYADTCFEKFGDRVKHWMTFNEPHTFTLLGYDFGIGPPEQCSFLLHRGCSAGNSATEPYIVAHNVLLSHGAAVDIYRRKYKAKQNGSVGLAFDASWYKPATKKTKDIEATLRAQDFHLGWFLDPLMFGDYPSSMRTRVGNRLPRFSKNQSALLKGSLDFIGINHYTSVYAKNNRSIITSVLLKDIITDSGVTTFHRKGDKAYSEWLYIVPEGFRSLLNYIKNKYGNPLVIITENGMDEANNPNLSLEDALKDTKRIKYHKDYLKNLLASIEEDGCNVKGYFAWSLLDNWEWVSGFSSRFGLYFVDYNDNLKRYAKDSAVWFKNFLAPT